MGISRQHQIELNEKLCKKCFISFIGFVEKASLWPQRNSIHFSIFIISNVNCEEKELVTDHWKRFRLDRNEGKLD